MDKKEFAGQIDVEEYEVKFVVNDFQFTFLSPDFPESCFPEKEIIIKPNAQGFIVGETYDGHKIAIYSSNELKLWTTLKMTTWLYVISSRNFGEIDDIDEFQGIEFIGGSLTTLFPSQSLEQVSDRNKIILKCTPDDLRYKIDGDAIKGEMKLSTIINESYSRINGIGIS